MPDHSSFDLDFRPKSYWVYRDPLQRVQATVKGEIRRLTARLALEGDPVGYTDPYAFDPALPDRERAIRGRVHPMLMGGEYLPASLRGEVEIARVSYASVTADVTSIRARWEGGRIRYRVVDEYEDEKGVFRVEPASSELPLTMGQLVGLIDTAQDPWDTEAKELGLVMPVVLCNFENGDGDPEALVDFVTVSSAFYPELESWYEAVVQEWCDGILEERRREEEEYRRQAAKERRRRRAEDKRIQESPPKAPWGFPPDLTVDRLTGVDMALLNKWVQTLPGIQPASVSWGPPRVRWGGYSKERYLFVDWTENGTSREFRAGAPFPTVAAAFAAWGKAAGLSLAGAGSLVPNTQRGSRGGAA